MDLNKQIIAYKTLLRREISRIFRIWPQTIFPPIITSILYLTVFGKLLGSQINYETYNYASFIIPGLVIMALITNSYENTVSSFFVPKYMRSIEELLVSPTPSYIIVLGYITGGLFRGLLIGAFIFLFSSFFIIIKIKYILLALFTGIITALIFSCCALINAIFAKTFDEISWFSSFILIPMSFLGGVFYDASHLQGVFKTIYILNPLQYIISLFRYSFNGIGQLNVYSYLICLVGFFSLLFYFACLLIDKGIRLKE